MDFKNEGAFDELKQFNPKFFGALENEHRQRVWKHRRMSDLLLYSP